MDRRWAWYQQVLDAIVAVLGIGLAITMAARDSWPLYGVLMVIFCLGKIGTGQLLRSLGEVGRDKL